MKGEEMKGEELPRLGEYLPKFTAEEEKYLAWLLGTVREAAIREAASVAARAASTYVSDAILALLDQPKDPKP